MESLKTDLRNEDGIVRAAEEGEREAKEEVRKVSLSFCWCFEREREAD